jgi:glycosyltransferase involved in cell wall biosynthesis
MAERGSLLVVSHPAVLAVNQRVYAKLRALGWDVRLVVPSRWPQPYAAGKRAAERLRSLSDVVLPRPVLLAGRPQRHFYLARATRLLRALRPDVLFLEEEPFSVSALQWSRAARRTGVPFGLQAWENLDRALPAPARAIRRSVLPHASFVAARSPAAAEQLRRAGAGTRARIAPHGVPSWPLPDSRRNGRFTIGFAGRLVEEKGVLDLLDAAGRVSGSRVLLVGDGPLREEALRRPDVEVRTGVAHDDMPDAYAEMDVLVLPSRTTARWSEQFGRVLVEALACGVPVIGSDSGEIPWVIESTGGGVVYPEGNTDALAHALAHLRDEPTLRARLAERGRAEVQERFSIDAAAGALDELLQEATR